MKAALVAVALAGCATGTTRTVGTVAAPDQVAPPAVVALPVEPEPPVFGAGRCDPKLAQQLVGRAATPAVVAQAVALTKSRTSRVIAPGAAVTQDYRTDRLNIDVSAGRSVVRLWCG